MKRLHRTVAINANHYIKSGTGSRLKSGSYLLNRHGDLIPVMMHVPSTTYVSRGLPRLSCTDAEFLYNEGYISKEEVGAIIYYNLGEWLESEGKNLEALSMMDSINFVTYAELRYAPQVRQIYMSEIPAGTNVALGYADVQEGFELLNEKWYSFLSDHFVKVSVLNNYIEFRISSDGYDWNSEIIDDVLVNPQYDFTMFRITISRETAAGYKVYFLNATLSDILEHDDAILSAVQLDDGALFDRRIVNGVIKYVKIK